MSLNFFFESAMSLLFGKRVENVCCPQLRGVSAYLSLEEDHLEPEAQAQPGCLLGEEASRILLALGHSGILHLL